MRLPVRQYLAISCDITRYCLTDSRPAAWGPGTMSRVTTASLSIAFQAIPPHVLQQHRQQRCNNNNNNRDNFSVAEVISVVCVVCHFVTSPVAPVLPVVIVVCVVVLKSTRMCCRKNQSAKNYTRAGRAEFSLSLTVSGVTEATWFLKENSKTCRHFIVRT